ncbi:MAG: hydrogenase maturation protease [Gemmatimonadales bacterium]
MIDSHWASLSVPLPDTERDDSAPFRILCLGNDLLADDALGIVVADLLRTRLGDDCEVVATTETGFRLLDYLLHARRMIVVDTVMTGQAPPGTMYIVEEDDLRDTPGGSPHYVGLFEALAVGRMLQQPVPDEMVIVVVEGGDCRTVGGDMGAAVKDAVPRVVDLIERIVQSTTADGFNLEGLGTQP